MLEGPVVVCPLATSRNHGRVLRANPSRLRCGRFDGVMTDAQLSIGRLAPSPTGAQHVGNARTYLLAWLSIRSRGGRVSCGWKDIDSPRVSAARRTSDRRPPLARLDWTKAQTSAGHTRRMCRRSGWIYTATRSKSSKPPSAFTPAPVRARTSMPPPAPHTSARKGRSILALLHRRVAMPAY